LEEVNMAYSECLIHMCKDYANEVVKQALMYWVDKYGFNVMAHTGKEWIDVRFPFPTTMENAASTRKQLVATLEAILTKL